MTFILEQPVTVEQAYSAAVAYLSQSNIQYGQGSFDAFDEALWALQAATKIPFDTLEASPEQVLSANAAVTLMRFVNERVSSRQPLAYITGNAWFAGLELSVNHDTIIPRSHLVEWIEEGFAPWLQMEKLSSVLDLCCGSGCIGIALAYYHQHLNVDVVDVSSAALHVANANIKRYALDDRVASIQSDLYSALERRYDLIVCNPPYVARESVIAFPHEFSQEPVQAHLGGDDGLDLVVPIMRDAPTYLSEGGYLVIELGSAALAFERRYPDHGLTWLATHSDENVVLLASKAELEALTW